MQPEPEIRTVADMGAPPRPLALEVAIEAAPGVVLWGDLTLPRGRSSRGIVVLPGGLGSSRVSTGNGRAAKAFNAAGIATLRVGLLTAVEEEYLANVFDVELLARRLLAATRWLARRPETASLAPGYFVAGADAAAVALRAAADRSEVGQRASVCAVLSSDAPLARASERGGEERPHVLLIRDCGDAEVMNLAAGWFLEHLGHDASPPRRRTRRLAHLRSVARAEALPVSPR
jgi:putative phosphoribosyl transferase